MHVTLRVVAGLGGLRQADTYHACRKALGRAARRRDCRIVHVSIQDDHLHLIVEAEDADALSRGMKGLEVSAARHINVAISKRTGVKRTGQVFDDRFHTRALTTPKMVRNALRYVLNNWRHHDQDEGLRSRSWNVDPYSSAVAFTGWLETNEASLLHMLPSGYKPLPVQPARTWLLAVAWKRHGLISFYEVPGP